MKVLWKKYSHNLIMLYGVFYLFWFLHLEKTITDYHLMHSFLDDFIPFSEYFIVPYLLWFVYVGFGFTYFSFFEKSSFYRFCAFIYIGQSFVMLICMLYPNGTNLRPVIDPNKNIFSALVALLHTTDTPTNVFPSIHVFNSIGVHLSILHSPKLKSKVWLKRASFILMVSICASTVFLKQHSILDVFGGILLSAVFYILVYRTDYSALLNLIKVPKESGKEA
ncbi:hypothetical protein FACS189418_0440 [Clostridia bacterium]|nr:hypothetical protein FACS189418_0440 [Clostridia bacterium]